MNSALTFLLIMGVITITSVLVLVGFSLVLALEKLLKDDNDDEWKD